MQEAPLDWQQADSGEAHPDQRRRGVPSTGGVASRHHTHYLIASLASDPAFLSLSIAQPKE